MESPWYNILKYGAVGDGQTPDTQAVQQTIQACADCGGGRVVIPPGTFLIGPIELLSNVSLHLEPGAVLLASVRLDDYPVESDGVSMESDRAGLISARNAENVSITGSGAIDGRGYRFVDPERWKTGQDFDRMYTRQGDDFQNPVYGSQHGPLDHGPRPGNLIRFINCKNVLMRDATIQNSPTWTIQVNNCEIVNLTGLRIHSLGSDCKVPNDDGIDLRFSRRIHISDCDIQTGDDCIALFGSQNVTVTNCTLQSRSAGIRLGFYDQDTRNCTFSNLVIESNRGLNVCVRGEGGVENILFTDIVLRTALVTGHWWGKAEPIHVSTGRLFDNDRPLGRIRKIRFNNILADSEAGIVIYGSSESVIEDVRLENVALRITNSALHNSYGGNFDLRAVGDISKALFKHDIPGLYAGQIRGLHIIDFGLEWEANLPEFFTEGICCETFEDVHITGFRGGASRPGQAAIGLVNGTNATITECRLTGEVQSIQVSGLEIR